MLIRHTLLAIVATGAIVTTPIIAQTAGSGTGQQTMPASPGTMTDGPATTGGLPSETTPSGAMNGNASMGARDSTTTSKTTSSKKMKHKKTNPQGMTPNS